MAVTEPKPGRDVRIQVLYTQPDLQEFQVHTTINYFDDPGTPLVPMVIGG